MHLQRPLAIPLALVLTAPLLADERRDPATYVPGFRDPQLEELRERDEKWQEQQDTATGAIRKRQKEQKERERRAERELQATLPAAERPTSLEAFKPIPHQPPQAQFRTGTCWSFATTSMLESEVQRTTGQTIKLSEMYSVYYEYLDKALRYLRERGDSEVSEGSEPNAILRIWREYGAVPLQAYPGVSSSDPRHDHARLGRELRQTLDAIKAQGLWDEQTALAMVAVLLDRHLGRPPREFDFQGQRYTPRSFLAKVLRIDPNAYVSLMSTSKIPFYSRGEFEVPDNWWHANDYHNVPLDAFYAALKGAILAGYGSTVAIDVSEPGKDGPNDVMFIPSFDIPGSFIDQDAREYRLSNGATTDDHGVHLVGVAEHGGHDWFLVKDSGRAARRGQHQGYFFMRDDYVRLKAMTFLVHRDAVAETLEKFAPPQPRPR